MKTIRAMLRRLGMFLVALTEERESDVTPRYRWDQQRRCAVPANDAARVADSQFKASANCDGS